MKRHGNPFAVRDFARVPIDRFLRQIVFLICFCRGVIVLAENTSPNLRVEPAEVDFGRVAQQKVLEAKVKLINKGKEPIAIFSVTADCECTSASSTHAMLAPGEIALLTIKSETRTLIGSIHRMVIVHATSGDLAVPVKMSISPLNFGNWSVEPFPVALPTWSPEHETTVELTLRYVGPAKAEVTRWTANQPWIKIETIRVTSEGNTVKLIRIAGAPAGHHLVRIEAETTDRDTPKITFDVPAPVVPELVVNPNPIIMPIAMVGDKAVQLVLFSGWLPTALPRFELQGGSVAIVKMDPNSGNMTLRLEINSSLAGNFKRALQIYEGDELRCEVPVLSLVEDPGARPAPVSSALSPRP